MERNDDTGEQLSVVRDAAYSQGYRAATAVMLAKAKHPVDQVTDIVTRLVAERDQARAYARVLAHAYATDNRPSQQIVDAALAFEVRL